MKIKAVVSFFPRNLKLQSPWTNNKKKTMFKETNIVLIDQLSEKL